MDGLLRPKQLTFKDREPRKRPSVSAPQPEHNPTETRASSTEAATPAGRAVVAVSARTSGMQR